MTDIEYRALIMYHAGELLSLTNEPQPGYGLPKKSRVVDHIQRMLELALNLEE